VKPTLLSKSKYINGLQCSKYLWLLFHNPEKIPETDASTQHIFDEGHLVGELAQRLFPNGIGVPTDSFMGNIKQTCFYENNIPGQISSPFLNKPEPIRQNPRGRSPSTRLRRRLILIGVFHWIASTKFLCICSFDCKEFTLLARILREK